MISFIFQKILINCNWFLYCFVLVTLLFTNLICSSSSNDIFSHAHHSNLSNLSSIDSELEPLFSIDFQQLKGTIEHLGIKLECNSLYRNFIERSWYAFHDRLKMNKRAHTQLNASTTIAKATLSKTENKDRIQEEDLNIPNDSNDLSKPVHLLESNSRNCIDFLDLIQWVNVTKDMRTTQYVPLCSFHDQSYLLSDAPLYFTLGYMSSLFTSNRIVGHIFEEKYSRAQNVFFRGIRMHSLYVRLLTTPLPETIHEEYHTFAKRNLQDHIDSTSTDIMETKVESAGNNQHRRKRNLKAKREQGNLSKAPRQGVRQGSQKGSLYHISKKHMGAGSDVLFIQLDSLDAVKDSVCYTNQTNQRHVLWNHKLEDISIEKEKVIARIVVDYTLLIKDLLQKLRSVSSHPIAEQLKALELKKIYKANEIFSIEWMSHIPSELRKEVENMWKNVNQFHFVENIQQVDLKKDLTISKYQGYEFNM